LSSIKPTHTHPCDAIDPYTHYSRIAYEKFVQPRRACPLLPRPRTLSQCPVPLTNVHLLSYSLARLFIFFSLSDSDPSTDSQRRSMPQCLRYVPARAPLPVWGALLGAGASRPRLVRLDRCRRRRSCGGHPHPVPPRVKKTVRFTAVTGLTGPDRFRSGPVRYSPNSNLKFKKKMLKKFLKIVHDL
jgi:hypothetical protein